jgi:hypothetical protein
MLRLPYFITLNLLLLSCSATIPPQSIVLTNAIIQEGKRMHKINVDLLNKMFEKKRMDIDVFIKDEYTPIYIQNFQNKIPPELNIKEELPNIIKAITPIITSRRDSMQTALENQRVKLITKLNQDFEEYESALTKLRELLVSVVKVDSERQILYEQVNKFSDNQINLNKIESTIDNFILNSGTLSKSILHLNETINELTGGE